MHQIPLEEKDGAFYSHILFTESASIVLRREAFLPNLRTKRQTHTKDLPRTREFIENKLLDNH